ncbi:MAG: hypothetical protein HY231_24650 [Acidobacteria bacterium]|nr:hypothetical protein [Acidobacteriota bacterium]
MSAARRLAGFLIGLFFRYLEGQQAARYEDGNPSQEGLRLMEIALRISLEAYTKQIRLFRDRRSRNSHKEYTLSITEHGEEQKFSIQPSEVQHIFEAINSARICPYPAFRVPKLDGTSYQLIFGEAWRRYTYHLPERAAPGYDDLNGIKDLLIDFAYACKRKAPDANFEPKPAKRISESFK